MRGARRIELVAALVLAALLALMLLCGSNGPRKALKTPLETRLERILSRIEGVGRVSAMITEDADGNVAGVLIVADGLEDVSAYLRVQRAVLSLLETEADRVEIIGDWVPSLREILLLQSLLKDTKKTQNNV